jgi:hypothetical protein
MMNHPNHTHVHGADCGHVTISHDGHDDFLHDGHLHHVAADGTLEEHTVCVCAEHPEECTPAHACGEHDTAHVHTDDCGHAAVPHGDHVDYLVGGHLHHPHGDHCDSHGVVAA